MATPIITADQRDDGLYALAVLAIKINERASRQILKASGWSDRQVEHFLKLYEEARR